jgi:hypothetical protein
MPEGLSEIELGAAIAEHAEAAKPQQDDERPDRWLSISEAVLLSLVTLLAAYSGFAAAKWSTKSSVSLARATAERTQSSRDDALALVTRTLDSASFNAWFTAFSLHNKTAERIALRRLRPGYQVAFRAWLATDPARNPRSPPGPAYMPQYVIPREVTARRLDLQAEASFQTGESAGNTSDDYIRDTVFLASVLFLVGISSHFGVRAARYGLVGVGTMLLLFAVFQLLTLRTPP